MGGEGGRQAGSEQAEGGGCCRCCSRGIPGEAAAGLGLAAEREEARTGEERRGGEGVGRASGHGGAAVPVR